MLSVCPTSHAMQVSIPKSSGARFGTLNATDTVTFGKLRKPPTIVQALITLALCVSGVGYSIVSKNIRLNKEEARAQQHNLTASKISQVSQGAIKVKPYSQP